MQWELGNQPQAEGEGSLYSADGKLVHAFRVEGSSGRIQVQGLASGVYMLKIQTVDSVLTQMVQIVR